MDREKSKERKELREIMADVIRREHKVNLIQMAQDIQKANYRKPGVCRWRPSKKIGNKEIGDGWYDTDCGCTLNADIKNYDPIYCLNCSNRIEIEEDSDG